MNAIIEWANGAAVVWAARMWLALWQTAVLAAVVGLIVTVARRMSPALRFWLWMLVPLRLLVMPFIAIALPILPHPMYVAQAPSPVWRAATVGTTTVESAPAEGGWATPPMTPTERHPAMLQSHARAWLLTWLMAGWTVGIAVFALRLARGWLKMNAIARRSRESGDARVLDCAREAAAMLGLRKTPRIVLSEEGVSPFVLGFVRPVVVLPAVLADRVSSEELRTVLAHEFAHVRRRDALSGWVLACCDVIYFFNPVVHLIKRIILFERERACDEQVLALAHAPRAVYARALLSATGLNSSTSTRLSSAPVLLESRRHLERRLKSMASETRPCAALSRKARLGLLTIMLLALPGITLTARSAPAPDTKVAWEKNLGEIMRGVLRYQELNNDKLAPSLADLVPKYLTDAKFLICTADKAPMKIENGLSCSYRYIGSVPWRDVNKGAFFIAYDHLAHDGGRNILYFDGHTHFMPEQDFKKALAALSDQVKPLMAKPDFPGDRDRVKAFCEDKDFPEQPAPAAPAEKSSEVEIPMADIVPTLVEDGKEKGSYAWRLTPRSSLRIHHGWYTVIEGKVMEHAGGGASRKPSSDPVDLQWSFEKVGDNLSLRTGRTVIRPGEAGGLTISFKTPIPEGTSFHTSFLREAAPMTRKHLTLWRGDFVREGKTVKSVIYAAYVVRASDEADDAGFMPPLAGGELPAKITAAAPAAAAPPEKPKDAGNTPVDGGPEKPASSRPAPAEEPVDPTKARERVNTEAGAPAAHEAGDMSAASFPIPTKGLSNLSDDSVLCGIQNGEVVFLLVSDIGHDKGYRGLLSDRWHGEFQPRVPGSQPVTYRCDGKTLELNGAQYPLAQGRVLAISTVGGLKASQLAVEFKGCRTWGALKEQIVNNELIRASLAEGVSPSTAASPAAALPKTAEEYQNMIKKAVIAALPEHVKAKDFKFIPGPWPKGSIRPAPAKLALTFRADCDTKGGVMQDELFSDRLRNRLNSHLAASSGEIPRADSIIRVIAEIISPNVAGFTETTKTAAFSASVTIGLMDFDEFNKAFDKAAKSAETNRSGS